MRTFYDIPTQVRYWDMHNANYIGGIAYHDIIICGCCGGVMEIEEVIQLCPEGKIPIMLTGKWKDISKGIEG